jgi:periplasmic protein TonB
VSQSWSEPTANEVFKQEFGSWFWYSVAVAAVFHLVLFAFWPQLTAADMSGNSDELAAVDLPPEIEIPPPPEEIARPATPVVSSADVEDDITIPPTTFEYNTLDRLPPPPSAARGAEDLESAPRFVPMEVRPQLRNTTEVERLLQRTYPPLLRDAGVGGKPILWFLIDEKGLVLQTRLHTSSGYPQMDEAAQKVAEHMRFSPAVNQGQPVKVWVEIPIVFNAR